MTVAPSRWVAAFAAVAIVAATLTVLFVLGVFGDPSRPAGSGIAGAQVRHVPAFRAVELAGSNVVTVHVGDPQRVVVRAEENLLDRVTTRVEDGVLVIGTKGSVKTRRPMRVDVSVPALDALTLSGSGVIAATDVRGERMTVTLPGSGVVRAGGAVTRLDVTIGGSGDVQLDALAAQDVRATVSGSGRIVVDARRSLDATVAGSGVIVYGGDPEHVTRNVTGSGSIVSG